MLSNDYPEIKREYEALYLPDGSLVLNGIYGRRIHIATPPAFARTLLDLCDGKNTIQALFNKLSQKYSELEQRKAVKFLNQMVELGIIASSLRARRPEDISLEEFERFETEIASFQRYENEQVSAFDYFRRLRQAKVTVIGAGGNGSFAAMMFAAAGIGALHIVDGDVVTEGNLVRQIFYTEKQASHGLPKVDALKERLNALSRFTHVTVGRDFVNTVEDVEGHIEGANCVVLCADAPRFKINKWVNGACHRKGVPHINAFAGLIGPFTVPGKTPCFHCLERKYSKASGSDELHKGIVAALQEKRTFQYPSFVTGVCQTAYMQTSEVINFLTGTQKARTLRGILRSTNGQYQLEEFAPDELCGQCRDGVQNVATV